MIGQIGQASSFNDASRELSMNKNTVNKFIIGLAAVGFVAIREYDEVRSFLRSPTQNHAGLLYPHNCQDVHMRNRATVASNGRGRSL
jgi:hypothetical protein